MQKMNARVFQGFRAGDWLLAGALSVMLVGPASAAMLSVSLGNTSSSLTPGAVVTPLEVKAAQAGQPAPFDQGYGSDPIQNFSATWTFTFAPIAAPISGASIEIGLYDADFGSPGSQLASFDVAGNDLTTLADAAFEATGGDSGVYGLYSLDLGSILASLASGSVSVILQLQGPVQSPVLFPPPNFVAEPYNGAAAIFSTLHITTRDVPVVPEPGSLALLGLGLVALAGTRRRRTASC